jgi:hypothetical protein
MTPRQRRFAFDALRWVVGALSLPPVALGFACRFLVTRFHLGWEHQHDAWLWFTQTRESYLIDDELSGRTR